MLALASMTCQQSCKRSAQNPLLSVTEPSPIHLCIFVSSCRNGSCCHNRISKSVCPEKNYWVGMTSSPCRPSQETSLVTNFESTYPASFYAELYQESRLTGGHVIMLGSDEASRWIQSHSASYPLFYSFPTVSPQQAFLEQQGVSRICLQFIPFLTLLIKPAQPTNCLVLSCYILVLHLFSASMIWQHLCES